MSSLCDYGYCGHAHWFTSSVKIQTTMMIRVIWKCIYALYCNLINSVLWDRRFTVLHKGWDIIANWTSRSNIRFFLKNHDSLNQILTISSPDWKIPCDLPHKAVVIISIFPEQSNSFPWLSATNHFHIWHNIHYSANITTATRGLNNALNYIFGDSEFNIII